MSSLGQMIWIVAVTAAAAAGTAACTIGSDTYISSQEAQVTEEAGAGGASPTAASGKPSGDGGALTCSTNDYVKADLTKLTACGEGKGHCYAKNKVAIADQLVACPDATQVCVPDEILEANGQPLKSCTSVAGPGGCVTGTLLPELIKQSGGALKPDVCDPSQLCVPCTDPRPPTAPTPFCQPIGVHDKECAAGAAGGADGGAKPPPAAATPCCTTKGKSNGVCISEVAVPEAQRSQTKQDVCTTGNKCVPAAFVAGAPVKCSGLLGDGVCMDKCFNDMMSFAGDLGLLGNKGCGTTEVCVPCSFVSGQGVPGCK